LDTFWMGSLIGIGLAAAVLMRPWRQLAQPGLWTPLLAALVLLPWLWALPRLQAMPLQLQLSGAVLVLLCLGWPLAVWVMLAVSLISDWLAPQAWDAQVHELFFLGILPATLALGLGAALRRWLPHHPFIYILGRGFLGTALCLFAARALQTLTGAPQPEVGTGLSLVAQWLMAWGDAFLTGLVTAILVAFRPEWLATWSDRLYLQPPRPPSDPQP
jgi:uncharacterized membrane protein